MTTRNPRARALVAGAAVLSLTAGPAMLLRPAAAEPGASAISGRAGTASPQEGGTLGDPVGGLPDIDTVGTALPTAAQRDAATALRGTEVTWNAFGTPGTVINPTGTLGAATGATPVAAARDWLGRHAELFGLSAAQVDDLGVEYDDDLVTGRGVAPGSAGHVVILRQVYGADRLTPAANGLVTLALRDGQVTFVSSSLLRSSTSAVAAPRLSAVQGWLKAAASAGRPVAAGKVAAITTSTRSTAGGGWTELSVPGLADTQHVRLQALPLADGSVRPVWQASVVDALANLGHTVLVDAVDGSVLVRRNDVLNLDDTPTSGQDAAAERSVPQASTSGGAGAAPVTGVPVSPQWRFFEANPLLDHSPDVNSDSGAQKSVIGCWVQATGCTAKNGAVASSVADGGEWDTTEGAPTFTTTGNNAVTHEAWVSPLTPGGTGQAPYSPLRDYTTPFTDVWNDSGCDPTNLVPTGNDIDAVVTNLFVGHNLIHDWAYYLGFTETAFNLQTYNFGRGGTQGDPEIGNVQAGALIPADDPTGELPALPVTGRDNANQIAEPDGVPGITNQYLFQPLAGAFYSPCADGSLDTSIYGHEYTHAISNRMVGGANNNLTGAQAGAMGESWSDLDAVEYQFANGYSTGTSPFAVGAYATNNNEVGIRDYALDDNPLNYSDYGFDTPGPEVHADGEIWNGTNYEVRQAMVDAYDAAYPYDDAKLQLSCAKGSATTKPLDASMCPGNRRWIQLVFDAWLLQQGATSMLDARTALIAADKTRFAGADVDVISAAFARRGMGAMASTAGNTDTDPIPSFETAAGPNSTVTFTAGSIGKVYVGDYEARVTPVADTDPATTRTVNGVDVLDDAAVFTPGTYAMTFVSPTRGMRRFTLTVPADGKAFTQAIDDSRVNLAATASGGSVIAATAGSLNAAALIDGTEATNWGGVTSGTNVDTSKPFVSVDLAGDSPVMIDSVQVSALLRPADTASTGDTNAASRFTSLRKFAIETCTSDCAGAGTWTTAYTSPDDAFPAVAPRPVAPNENMRSFSFAPVPAAAVRLRVLENQCTGGPDYADTAGPYTEGGEPVLDLDPLNATDCATGSDRGTIVHASELQVFGVAPEATTSASPSTSPSASDSASTSPSPSTTPTTSAPASTPATATTTVTTTAPATTATATATATATVTATATATATTTTTTTVTATTTARATATTTATASTTATATASTTATVTSTSRATVTATVTATSTPAAPAAGQPTATATATPTTTAAAGPVKTHTRIRLHQVVQRRSGPPLKVYFQVVAKQVSAGKAGKVTLRLDGKQKFSHAIPVTLKKGNEVLGSQYRLPKKLSVGRHAIQVRFTPDSTTYAASASRKIYVTVIGGHGRGLASRPRNAPDGS